jgi:hypothetical protein
MTSRILFSSLLGYVLNLRREILPWQAGRERAPVIGGKINTVIFDGRIFLPGIFSTRCSRMPRRVPAANRAEALLKTIDTEGIRSAIQQYHELRSSQPDAYDFSEDGLNGLGYRASAYAEEPSCHRHPQAEAYPSRTTAYEGLGEAFLADGQKQLAIQN